MRAGWVAGIFEQLSHPVRRVTGHPLPYLYEPEVTNKIKHLRGNTFVDIGAGHGYYCTLLAGNFRRIIAIEPAPQNVRLMRLLFRATFTKAEILPCAVAQSKGNIPLLFAKDMKGHQIRFSPLHHSTQGEIIVPTISLGTLVEMCGRIDLVKLDVEGAEWLVLEGAQDRTRFIQKWVVELHSDEKSRIESWMESHGYNVHWIDSRHLFAWH